MYEMWSIAESLHREDSATELNKEKKDDCPEEQFDSDPNLSEGACNTVDEGDERPVAEANNSVEGANPEESSLGITIGNSLFFFNTFCFLFLSFFCLCCFLFCHMAQYQASNYKYRASCINI